MPHQCVHCGRVYEDAAEELLKGCECGSNFFFYIKKEQLEKRKKESEKVIELDKEEKEKVEKDVRDIIGVEEEEPVILDFESVKVLGPGKFEIDVANLLNKTKPLIYKLEEGKYVVDLASTFDSGKDKEKK